MTLTGSFDVVSTYMFRGIRQNATGIALWPAADLGLAVYSGQGAVKTVSVNFGTWNSLHTWPRQPERQTLVRVGFLRISESRDRSRHRLRPSTATSWLTARPSENDSAGFWKPVPSCAAPFTIR